MPPSLPLDDHMVAHFVLEVLQRRTVDRTQMRRVRHVVDHFLGMGIDLSQVIDGPVDPSGVIPFGQLRDAVIRLAPFRIVPHPHAAVTFRHAPTAHAGLRRDGAVMVGDVVASAIRPVAPRVVGAADGIAFDLAVQHHVGGLVAGHVGAHVGAHGVQQHQLAALATIKGELPAEEA